MTVFVVEDDKAVRESLVLCLRQMDLQPVAYENAEEFLCEQSPHIGDTVLVDIGLPGMSGTELIRSLQKGPDTPRIVIVSGKSQKVLDRELSWFENAELLRKPFEADSLASIFPEIELH